MEIVKNFLKRKRTGYYIGLAVALLGIITSFIYLGLYSAVKVLPDGQSGTLSQYLSYATFSLFLVGGLVYIGLSFLHLDKLGCGIMTGFYFLGLVFFVAPNIDYIMSMSMYLPGDANVFALVGMFGDVLTSAIFMIVSTLAGQVIAWLPFVHAKEEVAEAK